MQGCQEWLGTVCSHLQSGLAEGPSVAGSESPPFPHLVSWGRTGSAGRKRCLFLFA